MKQAMAMSVGADISSSSSATAEAVRRFLFVFEMSDFDFYKVEVDGWRVELIGFVSRTKHEQHMNDTGRNRSPGGLLRNVRAVWGRHAQGEELAGGALHWLHQAGEWEGSMDVL